MYKVLASRMLMSESLCEFGMLNDVLHVNKYGKSKKGKGHKMNIATSSNVQRILLKLTLILIRLCSFCSLQHLMLYIKVILHLQPHFGITLKFL